MLIDEADTDPQRDALRAAGAIAGDAFDEYVAYLEGLLPQCEGTWVYGEERYSRQLQEREALNFDARSLREMGQAEYERLDAEMRALCKGRRGARTIGAAFCSTRMTTTIRRRKKPCAATYEEWTEKSRVFLAEKGIVTMPDGESCSVEPAAVFSRPLIARRLIQRAAGLLRPTLGPLLRAHRAGRHVGGRASRSASPPTATPRSRRRRSTRHIPGHHWHITWSKIHAPKLRLVLGTPYFSEGWALYAERVMRERGFFEDPIQELQHLEATIFRAARIVCDTSLHMGEMTYEEGVRYMTGADAAERADCPRGGRALLLLAHPGVGVSDRVPRDPAHPRTVPGSARLRQRGSQGRAHRGHPRVPRHDRGKRSHARRPGRAGGHGHGLTVP